MRWASLATMTVILGGCQQVAWKPGASSTDLDRDMASCAADHAERAAQQDCLRKRGWVVRVPKAAADAEPADEETDEGMAAAPTAVAAGAGVLPSTTAAPATPAAGAGAAPATMAVDPGAGTKPATRNKSVPVDPLRRSQVQAWWKMGGQGDALSADIGACVDQLGPEHKPDLQQRLYTRGLIDCLKGKGWFGK
jgi:hypothetical protein